MIHHIVLFRLKPSTPPGTLVEVAEAVMAMKEIPEVRDIHFGPNLGPSVQEYSHVLLVLCDDMGAVQRYLDHPLHRSTVDRYIAPIREARLAADIEVG